MNALLYLHPVAQLFSGQIVNCLFGGMIVVLLAELFARLLRRDDSAARFVLWFSGIIALGVMPLLAITYARVTHSAPEPGAAALTLPSSWAVYLFSGWLLIAGVFLARIAAGFWQICAIRRRAFTLSDVTLAPELQQILQRFRSARSVKILVSDEIQSPTAMGLLSPAIVLPTWLTEELSTAELEQIFLHELSHLRRWDDWSNLLQKIVKALFFFHPAVWWMEKQISLEREMACDEAVLAHTNNPRAYAEVLVHLAEKSFVRRSIILAQAAVSRIGQTSRRITRILSSDATRARAPWKLIAPVFAGLLIASLASLEHMPQLIAFAPEQTLALREPAAPAPPQITRTLAVSASTIRTPRLNEWASNRSADPVATTISQAPANPLVVSTRMDLKANAPRVLTTKAEAAEKGNSTYLQSCEFVVVFVATSPNSFDPPEVWQIQMWHIAVLRSPTPQASSPQKVI